MLCCTVSVSILSSELDLAQVFDGIGKARLFEEYTLSQPFRLLAYGRHLQKSVLRKRFLSLKKIIFSDYVTMALVRVYEVIKFPSHTFYRTNLCRENYTCVN